MRARIITSRRAPEEKAGASWSRAVSAPRILRDAARDYLWNVTRSLPRREERTGEFDFEYGEDFAQHIEAVPADVLQGAGALQRRKATRALNQRQGRHALKQLSDYLHDDIAGAVFMFELLVPAEKAQLERVHSGDKKALRPGAAARG